MSTRLPKLKVRPRSIAQASPCAAELTAMLGCWATHGDKMNSNKCAEAALSLQQCMANNAGRRIKVRKPSINYHLARLGKNM